MSPLRLHRVGTGGGQNYGRRHISSHTSVRPALPLQFKPHLTISKSLATALPSICVQAEVDFHAAQQDLTHGFSYTIYQKDSNAWCQWHKFCSWLHIPTNLQGISDPITLLHIFAEHVRSGILSATGDIMNRSVEQYLWSIGQIFAAEGDDEPRHNKLGNIKFRLGRQLESSVKQDPTPDQFRPITVSLIQALEKSYQVGFNNQQAIRNLACIAFFLLLHP